jgi:transcriptional regulator with XRE-family HTH domain
VFMIGDRLRAMRAGKKLSQGEVERRTGLLRCYISRVENGHTVPALETLEKLARALEVQLYQLFYDGEEGPIVHAVPVPRSRGEFTWGNSGKEARDLAKLRRCLSRIEDCDRQLFLQMTLHIVKARAAKTGGKLPRMRNSEHKTAHSALGGNSECKLR